MLARVAAQTKAIRVAQITAFVELERGIATVRPFLLGVPLDPKGWQCTVRVHEEIAQVAAAIHGIDVTGLEMRGHKTRREHAEAEIADAFRLKAVPDLEQAKTWALEHLPPSEPSVLIHGDLLGQNILLHPDEPPAVLDWEYAGLGDPACDLAIVTRGKPKPFNMPSGFSSLLVAYSAAGRRGSSVPRCGSMSCASLPDGSARMSRKAGREV